MLASATCGVERSSERERSTPLRSRERVNRRWDALCDSFERAAFDGELLVIVWDFDKREVEVDLIERSPRRPALLPAPGVLGTWRIDEPVFAERARDPADIRERLEEVDSASAPGEDRRRSQA